MPRYFIWVVFLGYVFFAGSTATAQPSFRCTGNLNATERAICGDRGLAALDVRMARLFRDRFRSLPQRRQTRLREQQLIWLRWRNSCGRGVACLTRRYNERITDLDPDALASITPSGTTSFGPNDVVERRLRNNRFETVYGDGRIEWTTVGGGNSGTDYPDGRTEMFSAIQIPGAPVPPLPANMSDWGQSVETDILTIVDRLLPEQDRGPYRDLFAHEPYPERMLSHLGAIRHLVGQ